MIIPEPFIPDRRIRLALAGSGRILPQRFGAPSLHDGAKLVRVCHIKAEVVRRGEARALFRGRGVIG
jgi:hypothetical protein